MKVVLDTHALYHAVESPEELTAAGRGVVEDPANELLISAITVWEFGLHADRGKIRFADGVDRWAPLTTRVAGPEQRAAAAQVNHAYAMRESWSWRQVATIDCGIAMPC